METHVVSTGMLNTKITQTTFLAEFKINGTFEFSPGVRWVSRSDTMCI